MLIIIYVILAVISKLNPTLRGAFCHETKLGLCLQPPIQVYGVEGRYATALYSAASKQKNLDKVEQELGRVAVSVSLFKSLDKCLCAFPTEGPVHLRFLYQI